LGRRYITMDSRLPFRGKEAKQMWKRIQRDEGGFTLVELLVTIAIMSVLFGIVALSLRGIGSDATTQAKAAELAVVQSAVDIYFAAETTAGTTITPRTVAATIASTDSDAPFRTYMRLPTGYTYTWDTDGLVSQP